MAKNQKKNRKNVSEEELNTKRKKSKEAMRKLRERIRSDPAKYEESKRKERERYNARKAAGKIKSVKDMPPREQERRRKKWRVEFKKRNTKKKESKRFEEKFLDEQTPPANDSPGVSDRSFEEEDCLLHNTMPREVSPEIMIPARQKHRLHTTFPLKPITTKVYPETITSCTDTAKLSTSCLKENTNTIMHYSYINTIDNRATPLDPRSTNNATKPPERGPSLTFNAASVSTSTKSLRSTPFKKLSDYKKSSSPQKTSSNSTLTNDLLKTSNSVRIYDAYNNDASPPLKPKKFVSIKKQHNTPSTSKFLTTQAYYHDISHRNTKENSKFAAQQIGNITGPNVEESYSSAESVRLAVNANMNNEETFGIFTDNMPSFDKSHDDLPNTKISLTEFSPQISLHSHGTIIAKLPNKLSNINWDMDNFEEEPDHGTFKNRHDNSKEFNKYYAHSDIIVNVLRATFGLISFRPHQKEIVNAVMLHHDCFVLMPPGGGKSLCYQLPALLMPGVTVVISPLRVLISNQVAKLHALDINAAHLCSDVSKTDYAELFKTLSMQEPSVKLLFLTPEKITATRIIMDMLDSLYRRGKLARFVIDKAHCLSRWGHDFRTHYTDLSILRKKYETVPIICLTATATTLVEHDVINILGLKDVKRFIRSLNRPNIKYLVRQKHSQQIATEDIAQLLQTTFSNMSGIVYCLSKIDCETMTEYLTTVGIKARSYHAEMDDKIRATIHREWMQDRFYVIVSTIAFDLGIDKPDVRFVIHNSIPKSLEAFYHESGRAGRDGEVSHSFLYYSFADVRSLLSLMCQDRNISKHTLVAHKKSLKEIVDFAENLVDCRRYLQLLHFGERYDRLFCIANKVTVCDNCENFDTFKTVDFTKEAKQLCEIVLDLSLTDNVTMHQVADIYRGSTSRKLIKQGHTTHPYYGAGAALDRNEIHRILQKLLVKNILDDFCTHTRTSDFPVVYITVGPKFPQFFNSTLNHLLIHVYTKNATNTNAKIGPSIRNQTTPTYQSIKTAHFYRLTKTRCHEELLEESRRLALERNLTLSSVMELSALKTMSDVLPANKKEMLQIQHVTNANYAKFGNNFLRITRKYRGEEYDAVKKERLARKHIENSSKGTKKRRTKR